MLTFGPVTVTLMNVGEMWPSPKRGHPPFLVEREPCLAFSLGNALVRVVTLSELSRAGDAVFRGTHNRRYWELEPLQIARLKRWAPKAAALLPPPAPSTASKPPRPKREVKPNGRKVLGGVAGLKALRNTVDVDYWKSLSSTDAAWLNQALGELYGNRWENGTEHFFAKGTPERRKLQFEYNRRGRDIWNHPDSQRQPSDERCQVAPEWDRPAVNPATQEDNIIDAIDKEYT